MAESIAVHFREANWDELRPALDRIAEHLGDHNQWNYPRQELPHVFLYPYDDWVNELEDDEVDKLIACLGDFPSATLCIELRRSMGSKACDSAAYLAELLLETYAGVVDDACGGWWALEDIRHQNTQPGERFLDCYRHHK